jgi:hypothetical protein
VLQSALLGSVSAVGSINSTPVIDLASNTLYVMIYTLENLSYVYRLHALDLGTLADKVTPVVVQATAQLDDRSNRSFVPGANQQRSALLEANGNIYTAFGSFCDRSANITRGWLLGWQTGSLTTLAANKITNKLTRAQSPDGFLLAGIWMSGFGVAADGAGLYFATGNSDFSGTTYNSTYNLSESVVKMSSDLTRVLNYFTPSGAEGVVFLGQNDGDFGSGEVLLLPGQPGNLDLAVAAGKAGIMYLLDRHYLGGHHNPDRELGTFSTGSCWCGECYLTGWDGIGRVVSSGGSNIVIWRL